MTAPQRAEQSQQRDASQLQQQAGRKRNRCRPSYEISNILVFIISGFEVLGYDKEGRKVFHVLVEAPNEIVAKLYTTVHLQRTPMALTL